MTDPSPGRPASVPPVQYKGEDLDPERGPGLGCFWIQMILLGALLIATPLSVSMGAPSWVSAILLFATLGLLLVSGQTIIFLLRLVAADRREGRRRPLASTTRTVGELEDVHATPTPAPEGREAAAEVDAATEPSVAAEPVAAGAAGAAVAAGPAHAADPSEPAAPSEAAAAAEPAPPSPSDEGPVRQ